MNYFLKNSNIWHFCALLCLVVVSSGSCYHDSIQLGGDASIAKAADSVQALPGRRDTAQSENSDKLAKLAKQFSNAPSGQTGQPINNQKGEDTSLTLITAPPEDPSNYNEEYAHFISNDSPLGFYSGVIYLKRPTNSWPGSLDFLAFLYKSNDGKYWLRVLSGGSTDFFSVKVFNKNKMRITGAMYLNELNGDRKRVQIRSTVTQKKDEGVFKGSGRLLGSTHKKVEPNVLDATRVKGSKYKYTLELSRLQRLNGDVEKYWQALAVRTTDSAPRTADSVARAAGSAATAIDDATSARIEDATTARTDDATAARTEDSTTVATDRAVAASTEQKCTITISFLRGITIARGRTLMAPLGENGDGTKKRKSSVGQTYEIVPIELRNVNCKVTAKNNIWTISLWSLNHALGYVTPKRKLNLYKLELGFCMPFGGACLYGFKCTLHRDSMDPRLLRGWGKGILRGYDPQGHINSPNRVISISLKLDNLQ